ncbi:unnamed protein product [Chondrus crispus]|uniref:HIT-type domain-containing protein n=1 Tax=Chondrus crispus TaxID=2769 RepID=R7QEX6_CHOCR|nr:unnamed protein product [Chondrus crispus]CDF37062.1 unnamed protein product [Chondrus crispus]|eukprot:XP_005716881.1 unnamed protein product [Chondrus crispus]
MKLPTGTRPTRTARKRKVASRVRQVDATALAAARRRRLDALENDNHAAEQETAALAGEDEYDPDADSDDALVGGRASKKRVAKRARSSRGARGARGAPARSAKPKRNGKRNIQRWNKTLAQALEEETPASRPGGMVAYDEIEARRSQRPSRPFCSVCGFRAAYTCTRCLVRFCSVPCGNLHNETRCLKFTA